MAGTPGTTRRSPLRNVPLILALLVVLGVGGYIGYYYYTEMGKADVDMAAAIRHSLRGILEEGGEKLPDANGDLVPVAPSDPAKQLDPPTLVFDPLTGGSPDAAAAWKEFTDHLGRVTGKRVEFRNLDSFPMERQELKEDKLHVAGFSTGAVPAAVHAGFVPVCVPAAADGSFGLQMEVLVPANSSIKTVRDLKGHELTLTSAESMTGFKLPVVVLKDEFGMQPGKDYRAGRSGGHVQSIQGLVEGRFQAVAVASDMRQRAEARGALKPDQFRSIYQSPTVPPGCYGYHYRLKPELAQKVREAFLSFDFKGTGLEKLFGPSGQTKFVPIDYKKDWQAVRDTDQKLRDWVK
jgi:phosphonate transport system substrate-binding protein